MFLAAALNIVPPGMLCFCRPPPQPLPRAIAPLSGCRHDGVGVNSVQAVRRLPGWFPRNVETRIFKAAQHAKVVLLLCAGRAGRASRVLVGAIETPVSEAAAASSVQVVNESFALPKGQGQEVKVRFGYRLCHVLSCPSWHP